MWFLVPFKQVNDVLENAANVHQQVGRSLSERNIASCWSGAAGAALWSCWVARCQGAADTSAADVTFLSSLPPLVVPSPPQLHKRDTLFQTARGHKQTQSLSCSLGRSAFVYLCTFACIYLCLLFESAHSFTFTGGQGVSPAIKGLWL